MFEYPKEFELNVNETKKSFGKLVIINILEQLVIIFSNIFNML